MNNPSKKISVLVVDDDPMVRRINNAFLNKYKLETQVAKNGKEAVEFCISGNCFDLILMDMEMPIMDGPQVSSILFFFLLFFFLLDYFPVTFFSPFYVMFLFFLVV